MTSRPGGEWRIASEHIEVGSFIGLAATTGGDLTIEDVEPGFVNDLEPYPENARPGAGGPSVHG